MKISDLISVLETVKAMHGDLEVIHHYDGMLGLPTISVSKIENKHEATSIEEIEVGEYGADMYEMLDVDKALFIS